MLKVSESVNGKFDIVLSDGYKSQLHSKGKTTAKTVCNNGEVQSVNKSAKTRNKQQQLTQRKPKSNEKTAIVSKAKKPPRIAARFDGRSLDKDRETLTRKIKHGTMLGKPKNVDPSIPANENAAFVTKNDLASLLEVLTGSGSDDISTLLMKTNKAALDEDKKVTSSLDKTTTAGMHVELDTQERNINQNVEQAENQVRFQSEPVTSTTQRARSTSQENTVFNTSVDITKPAAMRSSFAVGAPGLVINDPYDDKTARHQQWIKDLELQIREKKEREQLIKKTQSNDFISQTGTERNGVITEKTKTDNSPVKTVGETSHQEEQTESGGHGRGRGLMSMMVSTDEADKQRRKIFEHQKAVQLQVEDRRRQKMEERERRLREEALEDDRLAKERKELQKQFEEELRKNREKEEQAKHRTHLLQEGISKAYESAQQLKREKRRSRLQTTAPEEVNSKKSHEQQDHNQNIPLSDNPQNQSINFNHGSSSKRSMVPPLHLSRSYSPLDSKLNQNISSRLSDSTLKMNRNSLSVRDVKTSYSEPSSRSRSHDMIHKWAEEDVGNLIDDKDHVYNETSVMQFSSGEFLIPFHRTASAMLMTESLSVPENGESDDISGPIGPGYNQDRSRKHVKKRPIPEVQPTRASRLREKVRTSGEVKNSTFPTRRLEQTTEAGQKTVQKQKLKQGVAAGETTTSRRTDGSRSTLKKKQSLSEENKMNTTPTHLSSHYTPSHHQEKILEQLSTLRKGLLMKDQEFKTKISNQCMTMGLGFRALK